MRNFRQLWMALPLLAFFSASGWAASSGTLVLSGTVPLVNDLVVAANGTNNTSLNISGGESARLVASVAETSNNATGYTITLASANGGQLTNTADATKKTSYQVSYNGGGYAQPSAAAATVKSVSSLGAQTTNTSAVRVNVTAYPGAPAGTYSDTLTLTIVANP
jgi:hypothetical protein